MDQTIVIPTRNDSVRLASCLGSILEARSRSWDFEVLVMDNSDDADREAIAAAVAALATGPLVPRYEARPPDWFEYFWRTDENGRHMLPLTLYDGGDVEKDVDPLWVLGGNLTIRRAVFDEVHGSHPDSMPPELEAFEGDGETGLTVKVRAAGPPLPIGRCPGVPRGLPLAACAQSWRPGRISPHQPLAPGKLPWT